uniref:Uncharacterized protein n=1 Tax=Lepeophtheirus salmonis TaxID=72036 RepID=A0A0K2UCM0_LEPSM
MSFLKGPHNYKNNIRKNSLSYLRSFINMVQSCSKYHLRILGLSQIPQGLVISKVDNIVEKNACKEKGGGNSYGIIV